MHIIKNQLSERITNLKWISGDKWIIECGIFFLLIKRIFADSAQNVRIIYLVLFFHLKHEQISENHENRFFFNPIIELWNITDFCVYVCMCKCRLNNRSSWQKKPATFPRFSNRCFSTMEFEKESYCDLSDCVWTLFTGCFHQFISFIHELFYRFCWSHFLQSNVVEFNLRLHIST